MAEQFKPGDRVVLRNGETGTILRVDGSLAHIQLDSSLRKSVATAALNRAGSDEDKTSGPSSPDTSS